MELENTKVDQLVSALKSIGSLHPAGSILTEIICSIIPNQRIDRIVNYVQELNRRITNIEMEHLQKKFLQPEFIDLFEDSCIQASKALGDERLKYLASILVNGIHEENLKYFRSKRYLSILSELTDQEVIVLGSYYYPSTRNLEYHVRHEKLLRPKRATFASDNSEVEDETVFESILFHLCRLGLLDTCYQISRDIAIPETDSNGRLKVASYLITELGKRFIKFIELS
ncbi:hypothetical protein [Legionella longbeachae]|uniref:hypothetical protein n=1 Tax=Legionella longbeachae TaxID=450 RepID=UPI001245004E|nr:hypothetical protein [Legionella longbeachae]QEY50928.1 hypothetical protein FQU71_06495 [Legionella longbeachae]